MDSGINIPYKNWRSLKGTVKTSMHWATPKTDKMIKNDTLPQNKSTSNSRKKEENLQTQSSTTVENKVDSRSKNIETNQSTVKDTKKSRESEDEIDENMDQDNENDDPDDGITYDPTHYKDLKYRVNTPPPDWAEDQSIEKKNNTLQHASQTSTDKKEDTQISR